VDGVVAVNNNLQIQNRPPTGNPSQNTRDMKSGNVQERPIGQKETELQEQGVRVIRGEVLRVEGQNYFVKDQEGREVRFQTDTTSIQTEKIQSGDRIEAKVDDNNHALSLLPVP
jgi:hypothetical protein